MFCQVSACSHPRLRDQELSVFEQIETRLLATTGAMSFLASLRWAREIKLLSVGGGIGARIRVWPALGGSLRELGVSVCGRGSPDAEPGPRVGTVLLP